uniref:CTLH domain-containing protein n=1 Tax=Chenopodium quinoa TaxID=63459 RepID=A0A803LKF7_CHEQI
MRYSCSGFTPSMCFDFPFLLGIIKFILEDNTLKAIELTKEVTPDLLEENKDLHFDLLSLHFVKLVCSGQCVEALRFAQENLSPYGSEQKYVVKLEEFLALLAYDEPEKSPSFHLISLDYRQDIADKINRAILAHTKQPSYSSLERLIQQMTVVKQHLSQEPNKDGPPFSLKDFIDC